MSLTIDKLKREAAAFAKKKKLYISNNKQLQFRFNNKLSAPAHPRKLPPLPLRPTPPPPPPLPLPPPPTGGATAPVVENKSDFQTMSMLGEQQFAPHVVLIYNRRAELTFENVSEDAVKIFDLLHTDVNIVIMAGEKLPSPLHPRYFDFWISIVRMGYPELTRKYRTRVKAYLLELAKHRMEVMGVMQGPAAKSPTTGRGDIEIDLSSLPLGDLLKFHNFLAFLYHQLRKELQKVQFHANYRPLSDAVKFMQATHVNAKIEERIFQLHSCLRQQGVAPPPPPPQPLWEGEGEGEEESEEEDEE